MQSVQVNLGPRSYEIGFGTLAGVGAFARAALPRAGAALIAVDDGVAERAGIAAESLAAAEFRATIVAVPAGEASKSAKQLARLYDALADMPADRATLVVALGGGMVGDLAGFAAATFHRGLPWIVVPTTLLAMVDSSLGGKTAINHARGKNLIGAFHQPAGVWIDASVLATLPPRQFAAGMAEVVKYAAILDHELFEQLESFATLNYETLRNDLPEIIHRCCTLKATVVARDELDTAGERALLNFGHTVGHAYETLGGFERLLHGEAVALGMLAEMRVALSLGRVEPDAVARLEQLTAACGLPAVPPEQWSTDAILNLMRRDKKSLAGRFRLALPLGIGQGGLVDDVPEAAIRTVLERA